MAKPSLSEQRLQFFDKLHARMADEADALADELRSGESDELRARIARLLERYEQLLKKRRPVVEAVFAEREANGEF